MDLLGRQIERGKTVIEVVEIIMERDGLTKREAELHVSEVKELIMDAIMFADYDEVETIMLSELGLEMDYIELLMQ